MRTVCDNMKTKRGEAAMNMYPLIVLIALFLGGCSKPDMGRYLDNQPPLDLFTYFQGSTTGYGMIQDRGGDMTRQFVVDIRGETSPENTLILNEYFDWSDGEKSTRVWTIKRDDDGLLIGTAADVHGEAVGMVSGNVLNWRYYLNIDVDGRTWKISLDDWMYLQQDNVLINKTRMSKFGIHLGDITIVFKKNNNGGKS